MNIKKKVVMALHSQDGWEESGRTFGLALGAVSF